MVPRRVMSRRWTRLLSRQNCTEPARKRIRKMVGTAAPRVIQRFTHQLARHHWVASHQAKGAYGRPVPPLQIRDAHSIQAHGIVTTPGGGQWHAWAFRK